MLESTSLVRLSLAVCRLLSNSPEDALRLSPAQSQNILGELDLHPGQLPVGEELALPLHHLLQRAAEQGGRDDGPPAVVDLLQGGLAETLAVRGRGRGKIYDPGLLALTILITAVSAAAIL